MSTYENVKPNPLLIRFNRWHALWVLLVLSVFFVIDALGRSGAISFEGGYPDFLRYFTWYVVFPFALLFIGFICCPPVLLKLDDDSIHVAKWHFYGPLASMPLSEVTHVTLINEPETEQCLLKISGKQTNLEVSLENSELDPQLVKEEVRLRVAPKVLEYTELLH